jgi:hypothetical protein
VSLLFAAMAGVCFGQFPAPSDSGQYAAKVLTLTGQVSVMKDMVPIALLPGNTVEVQQMIVTGPDGHATFQVSDGSTFEVFPNSHLVFRKNAWNVKDLIDLLVGRIRVHIEHLGNIPNPNRVFTPTAVISVRGTTFDVTVTEDEETTEVEVEDGLVEVRHALLPSDSPRMVHPGETIRVYKSQPLASNGVDKSTILRYAFNAIRDAANVMSMRRINAGISGAGGSGSGVGVGDAGKGQAPPPPPPPPGHFLGGPAEPSAQPQEPPKQHRVAHALRVTAVWMFHQFLY